MQIALRLTEGLGEHAACPQAAHKPTPAKSGFFKGASVPREYKTSCAPLSNSGILQYICAEKVFLAIREKYKLHCKQTPIQESFCVWTIGVLL